MAINFKRSTEEFAKLLSLLILPQSSLTQIWERESPAEIPSIQIGNSRNYEKDQRLDNRTAFGNALVDLAKANLQENGLLPMVVFDCDLAPSTKTISFAKQLPNNFFQGGIQEHNTATIAGAISPLPLLPFFADFGVFGVDETYNQH